MLVNVSECACVPVRVVLTESHIRIGKMSKEDHPHQWKQALSNPLKACKEQKAEEVQICPLCLSWDIHFLLPWGTDSPSSQTIWLNWNYT